MTIISSITSFFSWGQPGSGDEKPSTSEKDKKEQLAKEFDIIFSVLDKPINEMKVRHENRKKEDEQHSIQAESNK